MITLFTSILIFLYQIISQFFLNFTSGIIELARDYILPGPTYCQNSLIQSQISEEIIAQKSLGIEICNQYTLLKQIFPKTHQKFLDNKNEPMLEKKIQNFIKIASKKCYFNFGCKNCPNNSNCSSGKIVCDLGFKLKGRQCVPNLKLN